MTEVYILSCESPEHGKLAKVGASNDVGRRIGELQKDYPDFSISLFHKREFENKELAFKAETHVCQQFKDKRAIRREWLYVLPEVLKNTLESFTPVVEICETRQIAFRIPFDLFKWLEKQANTNHRTLTGQVVSIIDNAMKASKK